MVTESFGSLVFLVEKKKSIETTQLQKQEMMSDCCAGEVSKCKSMISLEKGMLQFQSGFLDSTYERWHHSTKQAMTLFSWAVLPI